ncbi:hypothetical protein GCM10010191_44170 [Actinomadura vinacea]|uniref:Uncharacterized protein n=1 Tax=Actinomadura vinacea TaxID=115336 RepID=A0ABN3JEJ7_9ACTN
MGAEPRSSCRKILSSFQGSQRPTGEVFPHLESGFSGARGWVRRGVGKSPNTDIPHEDATKINPYFRATFGSGTPIPGDHPGRLSLRLLCKCGNQSRLIYATSVAKRGVRSGTDWTARATAV